MCVTVACGGSRPSSKEPQTAKEKQLQEARAKGEDDEPQKGGKKWGGWKYTGDRDDCRYVVGRRCFKAQDAACKAARCASGKTCQTEGAGPASVSCK
jgi:hypothetical protein